MELLALFNMLMRLEGWLYRCAPGEHTVTAAVSAAPFGRILWSQLGWWIKPLHFGQHSTEIIVYFSSGNPNVHSPQGHLILIRLFPFSVPLGLLFMGEMPMETSTWLGAVVIECHCEWVYVLRESLGHGPRFSSKIWVPRRVQKGEIPLTL